MIRSLSRFKGLQSSQRRQYDLIHIVCQCFKLSDQCCTAFYIACPAPCTHHNRNRDSGGPGGGIGPIRSSAITSDALSPLSLPISYCIAVAYYQASRPRAVAGSLASTDSRERRQKQATFRRIPRADEKNRMGCWSLSWRAIRRSYFVSYIVPMHSRPWSAGCTQLAAKKPKKPKMRGECLPRCLAALEFGFRPGSATGSERRPRTASANGE